MKKEYIDNDNYIEVDDFIDDNIDKPTWREIIYCKIKKIMLINKYQKLKTLINNSNSINFKETLKYFNIIL